MRFDAPRSHAELEAIREHLVEAGAFADDDDDDEVHERARAYADRAQPYAAANPYIHHAAACACAAVGELEKAMQQVEAVVVGDHDEVDQVEHDTGPRDGEEVARTCGPRSATSCSS